MSRRTEPKRRHRALKRKRQRILIDGIGSEAGRLVDGVSGLRIRLVRRHAILRDWTTAGLDYRDRDTRFRKLKEVTAEQVRGVAAKYLIDDHLTVARLDPQPMDSVKPARRGFGGLAPKAGN